MTLLRHDARSEEGPRPATLRTDVGILVGSRIAVAALGWAGTLLVVRHLAGDAWGEYSLVFNLLGLLLIFTSAVGTRSAVRGFVEHVDPERYIGSYIILRFALGVIGYGAVMVFVLVAGYPGTVVRASALGGLVVVISSVSNGYELLFAVHQQMYRIALAQIAGQVTQFALTVALAVVGTDVVGFTAPAIACEVITLMVVLRSARRLVRIRYRVVWSSWGELVRTAIPFAAGQAFFTLSYNVDSVLLSKLQSFGAVGIYSIAYKFAGVVTMIPLAVSLGVTGRLVKAWPDHPAVFWRTLRQASTALFIGAALITAEFAVMARPAITTLYGGRYAVGAESSVLVVGGACLAFFTSLAITALTAQGRNLLYPAAGAIGLAVNVGLNLWLIPQHSYLAAAWITVVTEVVVLAILLPRLLRRHVSQVVDTRAIVMTIVVALATAGVAAALRSVVPWPLAAAVSGVGFVAAVHRLRVPGPRGLGSLLEAEDWPDGVPQSGDQGSDSDETPGAGGAVAALRPVGPGGLRAETGRLLSPWSSRRALPAEAGWWVLAGAAAVVAVAAVVEDMAVYLVALGVIVPVIVLIVRRPQRGLLLLAALVPFDGMLVLVTNSGIIRSWKEALVLGLLLATFVCPAQARARGPRAKVTWALPLGLLLVYSILTIPFFGIHAGITGFRIEYFYVLVPVAVWRCPLSRSDIDRLVTVLMIDGAVTAAYGVAQEVLGAAHLASLGYQYNSTIRFTGSHLRAFSSFAQPFPFAYFLMMVVLLGLAVSLPDLSRRRSRLFLASLPLLGAGILFAFVRGAWLGLGIGLLYLVIRRYRGMVMLVPLLLLGVVFLPHSVSGSVFQSHSLGERTSGWSQNLTRVVNDPFGQGLGSSGAAAEVLATPSATASAATTFVSTPTTYQPDNEYYNVAYELGLPGLWLFLMFLFGAIGSVDREVRGQARAPTFPLGVVAFLLAAVAAGLVSTFFEIFPMNLYVYLLLGIVVSRVSDDADGSEAPGRAGVLELAGR